MSVRFYYDDAFKNAAHTCKLVDSDTSGGKTEFVLKGFMDGDSTTIGISHTYTAAGKSGVMGILKGIYEQLRPVATSHIDKLANLAEGVTSGMNSVGMMDDDLKVKIDSTINELKKTPKQLLNYEMELPDDYLFLFKGTDVTFPTGFKSYLITDGSDFDVYKELLVIIDRLVGDFTVPDWSGGSFGFQAPPNGYEAGLSALKDDSYHIPGTFSLHIGDGKSSKVVIPGMVVNKLDIEISKTMCLISEGVYRPLMIELTIGLQPVKKYTKNNIKSILTK